MAEDSFPWTGSTTGDCGPYDAAEQAEWNWLYSITDFSEEGVLKSNGTFDENLNCTGSTSPITFHTGRACVRGRLFKKKDSDSTFTVTTPTTATRNDLVILRVDYAGQTVRSVLKAGAEGGGDPSLTQVDGTTWEIALWRVTITTGGAITLTDLRHYCHFRTMVSAEMLDAGAALANLAAGSITPAKLASPFDGTQCELNAKFFRGHPPDRIAYRDGTAPTQDDEFESATLNPKWTLGTNSTDYNIHTTWLSHLWVRFNTDAEYLWMSQSVPAGVAWSFNICTRGALINLGSAIRLGFRDNDGNNWFRVSYYVYAITPVRWEAKVDYIDNGGGWVALTAQPWSWMDTCCLRINRWNATWWDAAIGSNDYGYCELGGRTRSWEPTKVEVRFDFGSGATYAGQFGIDWFRRDWGWT